MSLRFYNVIEHRVITEHRVFYFNVVPSLTSLTGF